MPNNQITVHDCATGETIVRDMTKDELDRQTQILADQKIAEKLANDRRVAKESARAKLAALGLTEEEIAALIG